MIRINLLPVRQARKRYGGALQLVLLVLVWSFVAVLIFLPIPVPYNMHSMTEQIRTAESSLKSTNEKIAQFEKIIGQVSELEAKRTDLEKIKAIIDGLAAGRTGPVRLLDDLSVRTPKKVWLTALRTAGSHITLDGQALTHEDISGFMSALEKSDFFQHVELVNTSRAEKMDDKEKKSTVWYTFTLVADVTFSPKS